MRLRLLGQTLFNPGEPTGGGLAGPPVTLSTPPPVAPVVQQAVMPFAVQQQPAVHSPPAPATPPVVPIPADEVTRLYAVQAQLHRIENERQAEAERLRGEALAAEAKRGAVDEAFTKFRQEADTKYQALERQYLDTETRRAVQATLAPHLGRVRPENVEMLVELAGRGIAAARSADGRILIHDPVTGRPAADVINERLASAPFQVFFLPSTPGGAGVTGASASVPTPSAGHAQGFQTLGEKIAASFAQHQQGARGNPLAPRGLAGH
jgi:hypothetical protein